MMRALISAPPPGGKATTKRIVLSGKCCAPAGAVIGAAQSSAATTEQVHNFMPILPDRSVMDADALHIRVRTIARQLETVLVIVGIVERDRDHHRHAAARVAEPPHLEQ